MPQHHPAARHAAHGQVVHTGTKAIMHKRPAHVAKTPSVPQPTQRDMSYELDSIFSTRGQGELIATPVVKTQVLRTPGLRQLRGPEAQHLDPRMDHTLATPHPTKLMDLSGLGDIDLPIVGPVSAQNLLVGAGVALAAWYFFLKK